MLLLLAATVKLRGDWCFATLRARIPNAIGMPTGRCQGTTRQGTIATELSQSDVTCKMYDTALARLCLQEAILQVPDKSGIFWCWDFCKKFVELCNKMGPDTTVDRIGHVKIRVLVRSQQVTMTVLDLWKELEVSWRVQVSNVMEPKLSYTIGSALSCQL